MIFRSRASTALTPPTVVVFGISVVLALLAIAIRYFALGLPGLPAVRAFEILLVGYVILVLGVLVRRF